MVSHSEIAQLVLSYRWQRGWYYWHRERQWAAIGQWRRLPEALGWASGNAYVELSQELRDTVGEDAAATCLEWARRRGWRFQVPDNPAVDAAGTISTSQAALEAACAQTPDDSLAWIKLGDFYRANQQLGQAAEAYMTSAEAGDSPHYLGWIQLYYLKVPREFLPTAIERHQALMARYPNMPEVAMSLGKLLSRNQQPDAAIAAYREASRRQTKQKCQGQLPADWDENGSIPPQFIIVGVRKCGTTSLYTYLVKHPKILPSVVKEVQFFSNKELYQYGLRWYLAHFPQLKANSEFITGEASPNYFQHPLAPERIAQAFPNLKLIVVMRNPVDRFISHYQHWVREGSESNTFETVLEREIVRWRGVAPEHLLETQEQRNQGNPPSPGYLYEGLYAHHLERWLRYFLQGQCQQLLLREIP